MNNRRIQVGAKFGHLVTEGPDFVTGKTRRVPCKCDCGRTIIVRVDHLLDGSTKSCGCHKAESLRRIHTKHGEWTTKLWGHWSAMRRRCNTVTTGNYKLYGGRGIRVCDEWKDYLAFRDWALSHDYDDSLSLDRIDVNGDYCPENCRWATPEQQAQNKRNTVYVMFGGAMVPLVALAKDYGVDPDLVYSRVARGWDVHKALVTEVRRAVK